MAAPYAAEPGDGRMPLTLAMLTITPPSSCSCITALARWANTSGAMRLRLMIDVENRGDAVALSAGRTAAGVVDQHVEAAEPLDGGGDDRVDVVGLADVGGHERPRCGRPQTGSVLGLVAAADHDVGAGVEEPLGDPAARRRGAAGDDHDACR